jgi:predicted lipoprotein with Yx(FWY)xxD motif
MKRFVLVLLAALALIPMAASHHVTAQAEPALQVVNDATLGAIFADASGKTVYLFTKDTTVGESACSGDCLANWPPVPAGDDMALPEGVPGTLGAITATDGSQQLTYNDIPLYYWAADANPGDTTGQGVGNVWFVVSPGAEFGPYPTLPGRGTPMPTISLEIGFTEDLGPFLTDSEGMTLYLFTNDTVAGESACYDDCAVNWPPVSAGAELLLPPGIQGTLGAIERTDGMMQMTYNDIPLYYWINDKAPGDTTGQEVGDVWYIVTPGMKLGDPPHEGEETASPTAG